MKLNIRFSSEKKVIPIDPVFSNLGKLSKLNHKFSTNSKSFKAIYFFFSKIKHWSYFFSVSLRSLLFSNCHLAMFFFRVLQKFAIVSAFFNWVMQKRSTWLPNLKFFKLQPSSNLNSLLLAPMSPPYPLR